MKKVLLLAVMAILISSCESKFDKSVKALSKGIWITSSQKNLNSGNYVPKLFKESEKKIHKFSDNKIYVYNSNGNFENVFGYEKTNDNGKLKIAVKNLFSYNKEEYTVIVNDFMLVLIGGNEGSLNQIDFKLLRNDKLKSKLFQSNLEK